MALFVVEKLATLIDAPSNVMVAEKETRMLLAVDGASDGTTEGRAVGCIEGLWLGCEVGWRDGCAVGCPEGRVGRDDGWREGCLFIFDCFSGASLVSLFHTIYFLTTTTRHSPRRS